MIDDGSDSFATAQGFEKPGFRGLKRQRMIASTARRWDLATIPMYATLQSSMAYAPG